MTTIQVDVKSVLGAAALQGKVVQSDSDSVWYKQDAGGVWWVHGAKPTGTLTTGAFMALISPNITTYYQPFYDGVAITDTNGDIPEFYFTSTTAPGKCRRPIKP